jgi:hypothetical protein
VSELLGACLSRNSEPQERIAEKENEDLESRFERGIPVEEVVVAVW